MTIETAACSIRYAGEYLDNETGMYYLRARYYGPNIGRFISEDSYWGEDSNPLSLNLYTYAYNNPIRFIDPTGHSAEDMFDQIRKNAQTNWLINEINTQKETWFNEEQGAGANQSSWTERQTEAHNRAEQLRNMLVELESGNNMVENLVNSHGDDAGLWEGYQLSFTTRMADEDPNHDYSDTIRKQTSELALAMIYGQNAISIDAEDVSKDTMTAIEMYVGIMTGSIAANYVTIPLFSPIVDSHNANAGAASASIKPGMKSLVSTNNADQVELSINGLNIKGAEVINGKTYIDITKIALAIGCSEFKYNSQDVTIKYVDDAGAVYTYSLSRSLLEKDSNGRNNLIGVRELATYLGLEDTLSWWNDDNGKLNVTIRTDMNYSPVKVTRAGNEINIAANINFTGDAMEIFPGTNKTYADIAVEGILGKWTI